VDIPPSMGSPLQSIRRPQRYDLAGEAVVAHV